VAVKFAGGWTRRKQLMAGLGIGFIAVAVAAGQPAYRSARAAAPNEAAPAQDVDIMTEVFRNGEGGFVVTEIAYALGRDAKDSASCPNGMTGGVRALIEAYAKTAPGQRRPEEDDRLYERRLTAAVNTAPNGQNICMHPEAAAPDPNWRMVAGATTVADGIDLDGQDTARGRKPAGGTCGHDDFRGMHGERGVDNQWYRVIGCTTGFQSTGLANSFQTEMYTGSWGILVTLKGVDDLRNDPDVAVGIHASADPIQLSSARAALPYATYAVDRDKRYRANTRGRIANGVLTIVPVDVRFHNYVNSMHDDRILRDARLRLTFTRDGGMEGYLSGYSPIEAMYDLHFGARHSTNAKGELAPERLRLLTSIGRAGALGHTCNGAYHAMLEAADGHPDPATGRCTSISTQFRIRLAPAFVVDAATQSVNAPLTLR